MKTIIKMMLIAVLASIFSACSTTTPNCVNMNVCGAYQTQVNPYSTYNYTKPCPNQNVW